MKFKFLHVTLFQLGLMLSANAMATTLQDYALPSSVTQIKARMASEASSLGIDIEAYAKAVAQYSRVMVGDATPNMQTIDQHSLSSMTDLEKVQLMNRQRAGFASWLGIPVEQLDNFLKLMPNAPEKVGKNVIQTSNAREVEVVIIYCRDFCGQNTLDMSLNIYSEALNQGIPQYTEFRVDFVNSSGTTVETAPYKYNNFSGAWQVGPGTVSNCPTCEQP